MAPETRSRGAPPPPSRVYHSSPALQQIQFPARRKVVRTYGRRSHQEQNSEGFSSSARSPRQKTLTQIDFVTSSWLSEAPLVVLSESEDEGERDDDPAVVADKENEKPGDAEEDDEEPVRSGSRKRTRTSKTRRDKDRSKRRRTIGNEKEIRASIKTTKRDANRRRTLGDAPRSTYHTQTLTQYLGHHHQPVDEVLVNVSDDEADGFDDWLQGPPSPSPQTRRTQRPIGDRGDGGPPSTKPRTRRAAAAVSNESSRQSSVVPQTPARRGIRFEIPSSSQQSTPVSKMLDRYGAPDEEGPSPSAKHGQNTKLETVKELTGKPKFNSTTTAATGKLVIEDSFATESWGPSQRTPTAVKGTPLKDITEQVSGAEASRATSSSATELMSTPTGPRRRRKSVELGEVTPTKPSPVTGTGALPKTQAGLLEIPDSDDDDADFSDAAESVESVQHGESESSDKENVAQAKPTKRVRIEATTVEEKTYNFVAGPETQFIMDALESSTSEQSGEAAPSQHDSSSILPSSSQVLPPHKAPRSPPQRHAVSYEDGPAAAPRLSRPIREPLPNLPPSSQTQPLESQRVALANIQGVGEQTDRTDIAILISPSVLKPLTSGYEVNLRLPFKIPALVRRFWLYDGCIVRYVAYVEPGRIEKQQSGKDKIWRYHVSQMYVLNNPCDETDMEAEDWDIPKNKPYRYVPPAIVGQLMSNLCRALFSDESEVDQNRDGGDHGEPSEPPPPSTRSTVGSFSVSQQVEAQLQSDIAQQTQSHDPDMIPQDEDDAVLVPSTPLKRKSTDNDRHDTVIATAKKNNDHEHGPPPHSGGRPPIRPSQATTASQASTPERSQPHPPRATPLTRAIQPPPSFNSPTSQQNTGADQPPTQHDSYSSTTNKNNDCSSGSGSLPTFQDLDSFSPALPPGSMSNLDMASLHTSQLLTKSQMLSDSLLRDDARAPPPPDAAWDSD